MYVIYDEEPKGMNERGMNAHKSLVFTLKNMSFKKTWTIK